MVQTTKQNHFDAMNEFMAGFLFRHLKEELNRINKPRIHFQKKGAVWQYQVEFYTGTKVAFTVSSSLQLTQEVVRTAFNTAYEWSLRVLPSLDN